MNNYKKYSMIIFNQYLDKIKNTPFIYIDSFPLATKYILNDLKSDILRNSLPSRIFVSQNDLSKTQILNSPPICFIKKVEIEKIKTEYQEENFILKIYDEWIKYLLKIKGVKNPTISIFFSDDEKAKEWEILRKPVWISKLMYPRKNIFLSKDKTQIEKNLGNINIWRHKKLKVILGIGYNPFYYEFTSYFNAFFSFLYSISPKKTPFLAKYVIRQIMECVLLNILIVDERIARALWNRIDGFGKVQELNYMKIWIAKKIRIDGQEIHLVKDADKNPKGLIDIEWEKDGTFRSSGFDIIFIHQTIFDDKISPFIKHGKDMKEQWVFNTKKTIPYVIFHSGRGKQKEKLPRNVPFLEYSVLQAYVLYEPSKFFLTLLGLSAKE